MPQIAFAAFGPEVMTSSAAALLATLGLAISAPVMATPHAALNLHFRRFGPEQGLSHNTINDILQSRDGLLWLATDDGVDRWDGYRVRSFRLPPDAGSSIAMRLLEDSGGTIWVGMRSGLYRLDEHRAALVARPLPWPPGHGRDTEVRGLLEDDRGRLWVAAGSSLFRMPAAGGDFEAVPLAGEGATQPEELVIAVDQAPDGAIWVLTGPRPWEHEAVLRLGETHAPRRFAVTDSGPGGRAFRIDGQGRLWSAAARGRFAAPGLQPGPAEALGHGGMVNAIAFRSSGEIWLGTDSGLRRFDPASGEVQTIAMEADTPSWQQGWVLDLLEDRSGALWVGTLGGLFVLDPAAKPFHHLGHEPLRPDSLSADPVSALAEDTHGQLWVGTFGGGINRVDLAKGRAEHFRHRPGDEESLCGDTVWDLAPGPGEKLWVAADGGLCSLGQAGKFQTFHWERDGNSTALPIVRQVVELPDGSLWVGVWNEGALILDPAIGARRLFKEPYWNGIVSSLVGRAGSIWFGRDTSPALLRFDPAGGSVDALDVKGPGGQTLRNLNVFALHRDHEGTLWLATASGLRELDPDSGRLGHSVTSELPGSIVYSILEDDAGRLWLGTNRGLARVDPSASPPSVQLFDLGDGLGNLEFNRSAALRLRDGTMVFGGMTGLTWFRPEAIRRNQYVPPLVLTSIETLGGAGEGYIEPAGLDTLVLGPGQQAVTFEFAALSYTRPEKNRYAYRLEGLDQDWIDSGTRRFARYTNLPPGQYRFQVRGSNDDDVWNEAGLSLPVEVLPAFWQTRWFAAGMGLLALALVSFGYRLRVRRLLELERLRLRIATDLHDELGSELSGISLASALLEESDGLAEPTRRTLGEIRDSAGHLLPRMRDIVWLIDPDKDRVGPLVRRMQSIAEALTAGRELDFRSNAFDLETSLPMARRRDLLLLYRELLTNATRHSGAERIIVQLEVTGNELKLEVADNGCGFDTCQDFDGAGLRNVRKRAAQLGAEFRLDSRPGGGTRAAVRLPMTRSGRSRTLARRPK